MRLTFRDSAKTPPHALRLSSPCCFLRALTLFKLAKHIQSTLVTAIVAGLSAACEDSQEMDEQEWDEKAVGGASPSLSLSPLTFFPRRRECPYRCQFKEQPQLTFFVLSSFVRSVGYLAYRSHSPPSDQDPHPATRHPHQLRPRRFRPSRHCDCARGVAALVLGGRRRSEVGERVCGAVGEAQEGEAGGESSVSSLLALSSPRMSARPSRGQQDFLLLLRG